MSIIAHSIAIGRQTRSTSCCIAFGVAEPTTRPTGSMKRRVPS
jgi:hypothetical protein